MPNLTRVRSLTESHPQKYSCRWKVAKYEDAYIQSPNYNAMLKVLQNSDYYLMDQCFSLFTHNHRTSTNKANYSFTGVAFITEFQRALYACTFSKFYLTNDDYHYSKDKMELFDYG